MVPGRGVFPQSGLSPGAPCSQRPWRLSTGSLGQHFNEKGFLALLLPFQLTFRAAGFKLRGQDFFFFNIRNALQ